MTSYLNLDVNRIFEQYSISEIDVVNREIQNEIEKKKEELRTMVVFKKIQICHVVNFKNCLYFRSESDIVI